ncbi:MAG: flagellar hook-associated protein FlgL [Deltaproteobacteria bacterium]|jgi:flagellar hook-associated protein 3 FlgL|nr:flagellar hook-associated protein FlgL [Deltaproteobacteria bacterium]
MISRVSQRQIYSNLLTGMNSTLSAYMDSYLQSSTQKKVNKPSDDPYGTSQIMASNTRLGSLSQYKDNLSMAQGWLEQGESTLGQVQTELSRVITLLQQGASGTYSGANRESAGYEMREIMEEMLSYANTKFNGRYIFAGHKTDSSPYVMTLGAHSRDAALADVKYDVSGGLSQSAIIQFIDEPPTLTPGASLPLSGQPAFRYSTDGGDSWHAGSWGGSDTLLLNAASNNTGVEVKLENYAGVSVTVPDPDAVNETGTWIYVRPAVEYTGDTNDNLVIPSVAQSYPAGAAASAAGVFKRDVAVRIDGVDAVSNQVTYSYSLDDGVSWAQGLTAPMPSPPGPGNPVRLPVEGGFLEIPAVPTAGDQFIIRPHRADIDLHIGSDSSITINNVGLDIFGGLYSLPFSSGVAFPEPADLNKNLFEVLGRAVAFLETNSQTGCQETLDFCMELDQHLSSARATMGARLNRVEAAGYQVESLTLEENDRLSSLEDVDLSELMTRLSQQQLAYQSVLSSSSMIMRLSLLDYL